MTATAPHPQQHAQQSHQGPSYQGPSYQGPSHQQYTKKPRYIKSPSMNEFIDVFNLYHNNDRVMSLNIQIMKKDPLYKFIKIQIPATRAILHNVDLNKFLKNLLIISSDKITSIGNYQEYLKYNNIRELVIKEYENDIPKQENMVKEIDEKLKQYNTKNEFLGNKTLHRFAKIALVFLACRQNNEQPTEFFDNLKHRLDEINVAIAHKKNGSNIYAPPSTAFSHITAMHHHHSSGGWTGGGHWKTSQFSSFHQRRNNMQHNTKNSEENFTDINKVMTCPSIDCMDAFPSLGESLDTAILMKKSQSIPTKLYSEMIKNKPPPVVHQSFSSQQVSIATLSPENAITAVMISSVKSIIVKQHTDNNWLDDETEED